MPKINWEEISELKHSLSQERVIICGVIARLKTLDKRLEQLEEKLVELIMKHTEEDNG